MFAEEMPALAWGLFLYRHNTMLALTFRVFFFF